MSAVRSAWRCLRQQGVREFIDRYVYHVQQRLVVRGSFAGPPVTDRVGNIVLRLATRSDLERLDELERYGRGSIQRRYVEEGTDWLFVACDDERVVATERASRVVRDRLASRVVRLRDGQLWSADGFCLPEYRNQGISRQLGMFGQRFLAAQGYKESFGSIAVTNTPSLRMARRAGATPAYHISYVRILFWERIRVSENVPIKLWDGLK
jgi:hypothetical protein